MNLIYHLWNHKYQQNLLRGLAVVDKYEEELIISEYFRARKIQQTFFFCLFFFGPAGALCESSGVTCYSLSGNWAENVNEYLSSWWGCVGRHSTEGCKKVQHGGC